MKQMLSIVAITLGLSLPAVANPILLYDGSIDGDAGSSGTQSQLPSEQPWLTSVGENTFATAGLDGYTLFDTSGPLTNGWLTTNGEISYDDDFNPVLDRKNPAFPSLDATAGFTLTLTGKLLSETHTGSTQADETEVNAGMSLIVVTSDNQVIAINFRDDEIFNLARVGNSDSYIEANNMSVSYGTQTPDIFALHVQGGQFTLSMNGNPLISDNTTSIGSTVYDPTYLVANLITLGDISSTANVQFELNSLTLAVPEPFGLSPLLLGTYLLMRRRRRTGGLDTASPSPIM